MAVYSVIRYEPTFTEWLIYKYPNDRFNNNSKLIVSPGEVAIIVHNGKIEKICEEGTENIVSELLPVLGRLTSFGYSENPYPIEVYFINKRLKLDLKWGTSDPVMLLDPEFGVPLHVRARGQMGVRLVDYQYFYQTLVGSLIRGGMITFKAISEFFRGELNQIIKKQLSSFVINNRVTFFEIDTHLDEIQSSIEKEARTDFERFGLDLVNFSIESINVPDEDIKNLSGILHKKAEYEQLGDKIYRTTRGYDVLQAGAKNNSAMGTMIGVGLGMTATKAKESGAGCIIPPSGEDDGQKPNQIQTIKCPKCGAENKSTSKFCCECGYRFVSKCPNCGADIRPGQKFCDECGFNLIKGGNSNE